VSFLDERDRLAAVVGLGLIDKAEEERFRRITDAARRLLGTPMAYLNLVDAERLWVTACVGSTDREFDRDVSFCHHVVLERAPILVDDVTLDERFRDFPLVLAPDGIRAYAGYPLRGPSGHVVGTLCALDVVPHRWDATDGETLAELSAWAELELAHGEVQRQLAAGARAQRFADSVLSSAGEGICAVDVNGLLTMANPAVVRMTGWSLEDLLGSSIHERLHGRRPDGSPYPPEECPLLDTLRTGELRSGVDELYWRRDGTPLPVQMSVAPMEDAGRLTGAVVIFVDISARQEVERLKDEFVSVVSHELRTPLTSMRGSLGLLSAGIGGELPPEARTLVDVALNNTDRLVRLVGEILDLERLTAGRVPLLRNEHRLADVVRVAVDAVTGLAEQSGVRLEQMAEECTAWFDGDRLVQVLVNLLGNAVKFTEPGGTVSIAASLADDAVTVTFLVADTGRGIPAALLGQVFDRFVQVDAGDARVKGGSGLGLAIARSIVEAHGGSIGVDSEVGVGSTFTVVLPQRSARGARPDAPRRRTDDL
jgi:PAS domain S-box-containing protein